MDVTSYFMLGRVWTLFQISGNTRVSTKVAVEMLACIVETCYDSDVTSIFEVGSSLKYFYETWRKTQVSHYVCEHRNWKQSSLTQ